MKCNRILILVFFACLLSSGFSWVNHSDSLSVVEVKEGCNYTPIYWLEGEIGEAC